VQVIVVGEDGVSYGSQPPKGTTWKQKYIDEVRPDIADADWAGVHLTGRISYDKLITALQFSWAHIYLTYPFVLSWSLIEAMSAGAAIIASDTGPVREVMRNGENGILVVFFDLQASLTQLDRLFDDADIRDQLGQAA
jgi:glycosyltransferase involved in cell wall biosynthesis